MACQAKEEPMGMSWRCERCGTYGDMDEPIECLTDDEIAQNALTEMRRITGEGNE